jgi:hypothetical protein
MQRSCGSPQGGFLTAAALPDVTQKKMKYSKNNEYAVYRQGYWNRASRSVRGLQRPDSILRYAPNFSLMTFAENLQSHNFG